MRKNGAFGAMIPKKLKMNIVQSNHGSTQGLGTNGLLVIKKKKKK